MSVQYDFHEFLEGLVSKYIPEIAADPLRVLSVLCFDLCHGLVTSSGTFRELEVSLQNQDTLFPPKTLSLLGPVKYIYMLTCSYSFSVKYAMSILFICYVCLCSYSLGCKNTITTEEENQE